MKSKKRNDITQMVLVYKLHYGLSYEALAELLGLTKVTVLNRVKLHNWKDTEVFFIKRLMNIKHKNDEK